MKESTFKIGETYQDRSGREWVLVSRDDDYSLPLVFRNKATGAVQARNKDGRLKDGFSGRHDIMCEKQPEWWVIFRFAGGAPCQASFFSSEQDAKEYIDAISKDCSYEQVRGPFMWGG